MFQILGAPEFEFKQTAEEVLKGLGSTGFNEVFPGEINAFCTNNIVNTIMKIADE